MSTSPEDRLHKFTMRLFSISAPVIDMFGKGMPGMAGSSTQGNTTSGGDVSYSLKQKAIAFAQVYSNPSVSNEEVRSAAGAVEGAILAEATLSTITQNESNKLIDELMELVEARTTQG